MHGLADLKITTRIDEILYWSSHLGKVKRLYHKHRLLCVMVKRAVECCVLIAQWKAERQQVWQPVTSPSLRQVVQSRLCVCVCACVWMIRSVYHFPLRVAFQQDIPSRWRECWSANGGQDECTCHSQPHGISSSHARGQEVRKNRRVMTVDDTVQVI